MKRIQSNHIGHFIGHEVKVAGWLHALREKGSIAFVVLRDGWGTIQAVTTTAQALAPLSGLSPGSVIEVIGVVEAHPQQTGAFELHQPIFKVITPIREPPPVPLHKKHLNAGLHHVLDHAAVTLRHPRRHAIFKLAAGVMAGFRETLNGQHFTEIQTPKIVASATEGGANVFAIDYFGKEAYLAQSPQFYKQIMVGVFERVYEVAPVFRAEPHATARHINTYVSMDVELGFIENHFCIMAILGQVLNGILERLKNSYQAQLALLEVEFPSLPEVIPSIHFKEAKALLNRLHGANTLQEPDLTPQEERWLGAWAKEEHGSDFLFVVGYPMAKRPFYTHPEPGAPRWSNSFDLLFRGTELVTGGQRLHRYEAYLEALALAKLSVEPFKTYLEAFRHGMPPHGGFAIGMERFLMQLIGESNIRSTTLFPRDMKRLTP